MGDTYVLSIYFMSLFQPKRSIREGETGIKGFINEEIFMQLSSYGGLHKEREHSQLIKIDKSTPFSSHAKKANLRPR